MTDSSIPGTRDSVLLRIRRASDFPAMANTVNLVNQFKASEDSTVTEMANIILKDYALTTKVLKVVNSVHYYQAGQVTTISRAIFLLGFESIKNIAMTLMLFDRLQKNSANVELVEALVQSFCGGIIAQKIVHDLNFIEEEEAFLCTLLHPLGKIMVAFSMPEKVAAIRELSRQRQISENAAARLVLGISYEDIGTTIAQEWNFPRKIIEGMVHLSSSEMAAHPSESEKIGGIATMSAEMATILSSDDGREEMDTRLKGLVQSYAGHFGSVSRNLDGLISASLQELRDFAGVMNINISQTGISRRAEQWDKGVAAVPDTDVLSYQTEALKTIDAVVEAEESPDTIFSQGIQDINSAMLANYSLNDVIRIALETMYRGMQAAKITRALFFVRSTREPQLETRLGFGSGVEQLKSWFLIRIAGEGDIFNVAISRHNDLVIRDIDASDVRSLVPQWYRGRIMAPSYVVLLPLAVNKKNIGLYYLEGAREGFPDISKGQLNYLRILRDQSVLAIRQLRS